MLNVSGKSLVKKLIKVGGQNPIEAGKMGCYIFHGPFVSNFAEIYHYLSYLSKRILVIKDGKIVESGFTKEVLENPQSSYTKELLSSVFRIFPPKRNFIN